MWFYRKKDCIRCIRIDCNTERKNACGSKNVKSIPPNDDEKSIASHYYLFIAINSRWNQWNQTDSKVVWNLHNFLNDMVSDLCSVLWTYNWILPDRANNSSAFRDRYHHSLPPDTFLFFICFYVAKFLKTFCLTDTCYVLEKYIYIFIYIYARAFYSLRQHPPRSAVLNLELCLPCTHFSRDLIFSIIIDSIISYTRVDPTRVTRMIPRVEIIFSCFFPSL